MGTIGDSDSVPAGSQQQPILDALDERCRRWEPSAILIQFQPARSSSRFWTLWTNVAGDGNHRF